MLRFIFGDFMICFVPFIGHFVGKFPKPQTSPLRDRFVSLKTLGHLHTVQKKWLARKVVCFQSMGWRLHTKNYIHLIKSHHLFAWYVGIYSNRYTGRAGTSWKHSRRAKKTCNLCHIYDQKTGNHANLIQTTWDLKLKSKNENHHAI